MDPRDRADAVLARAQRRTGVVTPDNMASPMDAADTQVIPSSVVAGADEDPDATAKVPASVIERNDESHLSQSSPTVPLHTAQGGGSAVQSSARTQPHDTPDAPADMTFTGAPVQRPAQNTAPQNSTPQNGTPQNPNPGAGRPAQGAGQEASGAGSDGFVPTTKSQPDPGTSELARRLEGL